MIGALVPIAAVALFGRDACDLAVGNVHLCPVEPENCTLSDRGNGDPAVRQISGDKYSNAATSNVRDLFFVHDEWPVLGAEFLANGRSCSRSNIQTGHVDVRRKGPILDDPLP